MTTLYAQPYDISATGFFFDGYESFAKQSAALRNEYGNPVEEYELQWIDGEEIDCALASVWGLNQVHLEAFFTAIDEWDEHQKRVFIIAVGQCGYAFDPEHDNPDDFDVDLYEMDSLKELAEHFVEEGLYGEIPARLQYYIDYDAIARDLAVEYAQITIADIPLVYRCG